MKLGVISDIHLDVNEQYPVVELLAKEAERRKLEGLLLAGDISNGPKSTLRHLEQMKKRLPVPFWFVPGNHDMWDQEQEYMDSWQIYEEYKKYEECLCGKSVQVGNSILLGNIGWYDYSFGDEAYSIEDFQKKSRNGRVWQDSILVRWNRDDRQLAKAMCEELEEIIKEHKGKRTISVTHMIALPELKVPLERVNWDYFNAFLGSRELGEMYERNGVSCAVMGHVHYRKRILKNQVDYVCACLNYHTEWQTQDPGEEIRKKKKDIEE